MKPFLLALGLLACKLEEVVDFYGEGVHNSANADSRSSLPRQKGAHLSEEEKCQLLAFLRTLNDPVFVSNPAFSKPER